MLIYPTCSPCQGLRRFCETPAPFAASDAAAKQPSHCERRFPGLAVWRTWIGSSTRRPRAYCMSIFQRRDREGACFRDATVRERFFRDATLRDRFLRFRKVLANRRKALPQGRASDSRCSRLFAGSAKRPSHCARRSPGLAVWQTPRRSGLFHSDSHSGDPKVGIQTQAPGKHPIANTPKPQRGDRTASKR